MKRMIMSFAAVLSLFCFTAASAQSKDSQRPNDLQNNNNSRTNTRDNTLQNRQGIQNANPNSTVERGQGGISMDQDTSRRRRDTMRSPQPVPPVPPVPMPHDTLRR